MFRDKFTDFAFNHISSKTMGVWITNARDLQDIITPNMSNGYVAPTYADGRHYTGTTISSSTIPVKCVAIDITANDKRDISKWLSARAAGPLVFGYDPYHYYNVKIAGGITAEKWVRSKYHKELGGYTYIYTFTINFETVDSWCKLGMPVNYSLKPEGTTLQPLNKSTTEERINELGNMYNSYNLPGYIYKSSNGYILPPGRYDSKTFVSLGVGINPISHKLTNVAFLSDTNSSDFVTTNAGNIEPTEEKDEQGATIYYYDMHDSFVKIDTDNEAEVLTNCCLSTITNVGTENMNFSYTTYISPVIKVYSTSIASIPTTIESYTAYNFTANPEATEPLKSGGYWMYIDKVWYKFHDTPSVSSGTGFTAVLTKEKEQLYNVKYTRSGTDDTFTEELTYLNELGLVTNYGVNILHNNKVTDNIGKIIPTEIEPGNPETIVLSLDNIDDFNGMPVIKVSTNTFKFNHNGLVHLSFYFTLPKTNKKYSSSVYDEGVTVEQDNLTYVCQGYVTQIQNSNNKETIILLNDNSLLDGNDNKIPANCFMSISNAHELKFSCPGYAIHDSFISYQTREV